MTSNGTAEKPVSGMRVWEVNYVKSECPHCGWEDNRTKPLDLIDDELWFGTAFEQECEMCGKYYWTEVDDDDR